MIGAFCDLVWSDPEDIETWAVSPRGAGWLFGSAVTKEFTELNNLDLICRAHQLVQEGYKFWFDEEKLGIYLFVYHLHMCMHTCFKSMKI